MLRHQQVMQQFLETQRSRDARLPRCRRAEPRAPGGALSRAGDRAGCAPPRRSRLRRRAARPAPRRGGASPSRLRPLPAPLRRGCPAPAAAAGAARGAAAPAAGVAAAITREQIQERLLAVVSERTGYPAEMLGLDADLEGDLGIDSIKRVEIAGTLHAGPRRGSLRRSTWRS